MSALFTVKLDISAIKRDGRDHQFYLLMVDTRKMKMVYEFKLWIRFIFSLDTLVELVHGDAAIPDLEDVEILSLLPSVKVIPTITVCEEYVRQKTLGVNFRNSLMAHENPGLARPPVQMPPPTASRPAATPTAKPAAKSAKNTAPKPPKPAKHQPPSTVLLPALAPVMENYGKQKEGDMVANILAYAPGLDDASSTSGESFFNEDMLNSSQSSEIHERYDSSESDDETENSNLTIPEATKNNNGAKEMTTGNQDQNQNQNENHFFNQVNLVKKQNETSGQLNADGRKNNENINIAPSTLSQSSINGEVKGSQKNKVPQTNGNGSFEKVEKAEKAEKAKKAKNTPPKKEAEKPFSMSNILNYLRKGGAASGSGNATEENDENIDTQDEPFNGAGAETSEHGSEDENLQDSEEGIKKPRKRLRKHKPKKRNYYMNKKARRFVDSVYSLNNALALRQSLNNAKPRHIRFGRSDSDSEDQDMPLNRERNRDDEFVVDNLQPAAISDLRFLIDEKRKQILTGRGSVPNPMKNDNQRRGETGNEHGNGYGSSNGNESGNEILVKVEEANSNGEKAKDDDSADVLAALGNLRKNNGEPLVFNRSFKN